MGTVSYETLSMKRMKDTIPLATNCVNQVMLAMDAGDEETFARQFTEDGACTVKIMGKTFNGTDSLKELCNTLHTKFKGVRHWEGNVCLTQNEGSLGEWVNRSYWKAMDGGECISTGLHEDILVCDADTGTFKIVTRTITHFWTKAGGHIEQ